MSRTVARISDFCTTGSGGTPSRGNSEFYGGEIPWVKSGELREELVTSTSESITQEAVNNSSAKLVNSGAILLAMYGATVGRMAMLGMNAATNQAVCSIEPDPKKAFVKYVYYALHQKVPEFLKQAKGGAQPNISQGLIRDTEIFLPSLPEQKRIASILDKADAIHQKRKQAIGLADQFLRSAFLDLFGDPVTNPKSWDMKPLGSLVENLDGRRVPIKASDRKGMAGEFPYYGASGVIDHVNDYIFEGRNLLISEDGANLIARSSPIAFIATGKYWVNNHAHVLGEKDEVTLEYLVNSINMRPITDWVTGSAQPKLNQENMNKIPVQVPPRELIDKFQNLLDKTQILLSSSLNSRDEKLFESLSQRAFSGKL